jgi:hypothetical protein
MDAIATAERDKSAIGFDPLSSEYLADPYPVLAAAAAAAPVFYCESIGHWVVTRYHDIRHIFRTPTLFSAANANSPLRSPCPMAAKALEGGGFKSVPTLANVDPPAHTRVRKIANVAGQRAHEVFRREELYKDFIIAASKAYGEALVSNEPQIQDLVALYAMVSRMRVVSSPQTIDCADNIMRTTIETYFAPNKTMRDLNDIIKTGTALDPLKEFSEIVREELQLLTSL